MHDGTDRLNRGQIHDRMPLIVAPADYERWLSGESYPHDLMQSFPAAPMRMWPVFARVKKPENDDPKVIEELSLESLG